MRRNIAAYKTCQVFLNYPFDRKFLTLANAMSFAVVAGGLLPLCARDLTSPDRPRLEMLVDAISNCHYSAHDFSRFTGEGVRNFARMNMPIEIGMGVFYAIQSQRQDHRCAFFVPTPHDYQAFASDLAGLDPKCHQNDEVRLLTEMYEWLRSVVPSTLFNSQATVDVIAKFEEFKQQLSKINGSGEENSPSHEETRELMYRICDECSWWDWRKNRMNREEFASIPIAWKEEVL
jgi:hypothetical protein